MPIIHTWKYLKKTTAGIKEIWEKDKPITRSRAIRDNCLDCIGGSTADIKKCPTTHCPFWPFRPYQNKEKDTSMESHYDG